MQPETIPHTDSHASEAHYAVCASPYCGKRFVPRRAWQKFCTDQCRHDYHNARQTGPMAIEAHAFEVMVRGFSSLTAADMHEIVDKVKS